MKRRRNESERQQNTRLFHSCCYCGKHHPTLEATDDHEEKCPSKPGNSDDAED